MGPDALKNDKKQGPIFIETYFWLFVFNKFRGDLDILKPGFRKLKQNTGKPVFGTIPMTKFLLPEEDSITSSSKKLGLNRQNLKKIDLLFFKLK